VLKPQKICVKTVLPHIGCGVLLRQWEFSLCEYWLSKRPFILESGYLPVLFLYPTV